MENRIVVQVDEAALAHQGLLRHDSKCRQDAIVDRGDGLRAGSSVEASPWASSDTQRNRANSERDGYRENPYKSSVFRDSAGKRRGRKS